ncbi:MAG: hypothetical protein ABIP41_02075 [Croceibacterium sp.]
MLKAYSGPERRESDRVSLTLTASLREAGRARVPATVTTLTHRGCSVADSSLSSTPSAVWIRLPGLESLPARRCWSTLAMGGFEFDHPLHPAVARRFIGQPPTPVPPREPPLGVLGTPEWTGSRREHILHGKGPRPTDPLTASRARDRTTTLGHLVRRHFARVVDQRLERRFPPPSAAILGFRAAGRPLSMHDISPSGVKLGAELGGGIGAPVEVAFAGFPPMAGTIVWVREGATGVRLPAHALDLFETA